jgi:hypothetical protein
MILFFIIKYVCNMSVLMESLCVTFRFIPKLNVFGVEHYHRRKTLCEKGSTLVWCERRG